MLPSPCAGWWHDVSSPRSSHDIAYGPFSKPWDFGMVGLGTDAFAFARERQSRERRMRGVAKVVWGMINGRTGVSINGGRGEA